jgi:thioredoxin 1
MTNEIEIRKAQDFQDRVENGKGYFLVEYYATWCGVSHSMRVRTSAVDSYRDFLTLVKVDIDMVDSEVLEKHGVDVTPTYQIFQNGEILDEQIGGISTEGFARFLSRNISER